MVSSFGKTEIDLQNNYLPCSKLGCSVFC